MFSNSSQAARIGKAASLIAALGLAGCQSAGSLLESVDAGCVLIEVDGYFTDSKATGRALKLPEGMPIDAATVEALCRDA